MRDQFDISGVFETTEFEIAQVACKYIAWASFRNDKIGWNNLKSL